MSKLKTRPNKESVHAFLSAVEHPQKRKDSFELLEMMKDVTGEEPRLWGPSIVGFGKYHYKYKSGREGDWFLTGFSPRKTSMSLYIMAGFDKFEPLMEKLGKHKTGKSCLYVNKLDDIDRDVLRELISESVNYLRDKYDE